ncbi:kinase-like protein [Phanerochaete sordida]|uniref:non-specific serine/threonine protein kinase n=1 Tax=Phanerochaete sordida TaxID=48140 RepID=A0A9P3LBU5_9APHY|nr:kinase-like protein [Phanerochaete sordida]
MHENKTFSIVRKIGEGAQAAVYLATDESGYASALKLMPSSYGDLESIQTEQDILRAAAERGEPFIARLVMSFRDDLFICFVMRMYAGSLEDLMYPQLRDRNSPVPRNIHAMAAELVCGLARLHKMGYAHLDIKLDNILLSSTGHIVYTDFGMAAPVNAQGCTSAATANGTPGYGAPEGYLSDLLGRDGRITQKADVWSLGILLVQVLNQTEYPMYTSLALRKVEEWGIVRDVDDDTARARTAEAVRFLVATTDPLEIPEIQQIATRDPALHDLLSKMLVRSPQERWTAEQLQGHHFFQDVNWCELERCA